MSHQEYLEAPYVAAAVQAARVEDAEADVCPVNPDALCRNCGEYAEDHAGYPAVASGLSCSMGPQPVDGEWTFDPAEGEDPDCQEAGTCQHCGLPACKEHGAESMDDCEGVGIVHRSCHDSSCRDRTCFEDPDAYRDERD